jgi:hypothetical protein
MTYNLAKLIPVCPELEKIAPNTIKHSMLLEVVDQITEDAQKILPEKRSGFSYAAIIYTQLYCQMTHLSTQLGSVDLKCLWKGKEHHFQRFQKKKFTNGKKRQAIPDQPTLTRFLQNVAQSGLTQEFTNLLLWAQFLYFIKTKKVHDEITLIADYHDESCKKNKADPYCFGTKEGKTVHRTLAFSIIIGELHLVIATYKIQKKQKIVPLFQEIFNKFGNISINIKYCLLDRGFYRKDLLPALKDKRITTILPGRNCSDSRRKISLWIQDKGGRCGKLILKLRYVKKTGWQNLMMDCVLVGKRGHTLNQVKNDFKAEKITEKDAIKRIFPLLVIRGNSKGIKVLHGSENYIRDLYRKRWAIEIAFRETYLIGIGNWLGNRDKRLFQFSLKCFLYNLWQLARFNLNHSDPNAEALTLDEFCGKTIKNRTRCAAS